MALPNKKTKPFRESPHPTRPGGPQQQNLIVESYDIFHNQFKHETRPMKKQPIQIPTQNLSNWFNSRFFMKSKELLIFLGHFLGIKPQNLWIAAYQTSNTYPLATVRLSWGYYTSSTYIHLQTSINNVLIISSGPCLNTVKVDSEC